MRFDRPNSPNIVKFAFLILACAFAFARGIDGQKPADIPPDRTIDSFQLGSQVVKVPPPEGFTNVFSDPVPQRFLAMENPMYDLLAIHVPDSIVSRLKASPNIDLEIYTEISVTKKARAIEITPKTFAAVESMAEKTVESNLDPKGPRLKQVETNAKKGLKEYLGNSATIDFGPPKHLGFFNKQPNIFSQINRDEYECLGQELRLASNDFVSEYQETLNICICLQGREGRG